MSWRVIHIERTSLQLIGNAQVNHVNDVKKWLYPKIVCLRNTVTYLRNNPRQCYCHELNLRPKVRCANHSTTEPALSGMCTVLVKSTEFPCICRQESLSVTKSRKNVDNFLTACRLVGVHRVTLQLYTFLQLCYYCHHHRQFISTIRAAHKIQK